MEKNTVQNRVTPQGDVFIDGIIGDPADGLTSAILIEEIDALGDIDLHVFINSPGGDVFQGLAIFNRLANHSAGVSVEILGLAASMASVIAMSGDTITMPSNAMLMIHDPWTIAIGNAKDLRTDAAKLDMVKKSLVGIYTKKTGLKASEIEAMMQAETWLDAEQALAKNFIDQITEPDRMAACIDLSAFKFKHPPKEYTAMAEVTEPKEPETRAEKKRASGIMASIKAAKLGVDFATELIDSDLTLAQARDKIINQLAVPAALETIAQQMVAKIQPTTAADANPFSGQLEVIVEPRLDATSSTAWFLVADFAVIDTLEHAWLESTQGPEFFTREGWSVDGIEFKVRDDFGGGILDWRGFYKNAGV